MPALGLALGLPFGQMAGGSAPPSPPGSFVDNGSDGQILRWTAPSGATSYSVSAFSDALLTTQVGSILPGVAMSGVAIALMSLDPGLYWITVTAINAGGSTVWGNGGLPLMVGAASWLTAKSFSGYDDGSLITGWPDKSGNAVSAGQADSAAQPTYVKYDPVNSMPAVLFDGVSNFMSWGSPASFNVGTGDFTWMAWINPTALPAATVFVSSSGYFTYLATVNTDAAFDFPGNPITAGTLTAGAWQQIAGVRISGIHKLYINGSLKVTGSVIDSTVLTAQTFNLGNWAYDGNYFFPGYLDNATVFTSALSDAMIAQCAVRI